MIRLIFKNEINQSKINILPSLINSWNIEVEIDATASFAETEHKKDPSLSLSIGMWAVRDIDDKKLRELAW